MIWQISRFSAAQCGRRADSFPQELDHLC